MHEDLQQNCGEGRDYLWGIASAAEARFEESGTGSSHALARGL